MAPTRKVEVAIVGDASSLVRAFRQGDSAAGRFGRGGSKLGAIGMGLIAGAAAGATVAIGQGLVSAFQTGIREFSEAQKVSAQTAAAIKSTGGAAGVTQKHIEDMASSLQKQTGLQDDAIQSSQNLLLTFTKISNAGPDKIFDRATQATLDLSVALGKDMGSSAIMVGKALNDPIKGVTALGRAGVQFTAGQKETIKSLVETGRVADAQKLILKELETQVGGSAKAFGETTPGQVEKAKRAFEDLTQGVVTAVAPLAAAVLPGLTAAINGTVTFFQTNWPKIQAVAMSVWNWFKANLLPTFVSIGQSIGSIVQSIVGFFRTYWPQIWGIVGPVMSQIVNAVRTGLAIVSGIFKVVAAVLRGDWSGVWSALRGIVAAAVSGILNTVRNLGSLILGLMRAVGVAAWNGLKAGLAAIGGFYSFVWGKVSGAISSLVGAVLGAFAAVGRAIVDGIKSGISATWQGLVGFLADKVGGLAGIAGGILGIGSPSRVFAEKVGGPISEGIAQGVRKKGHQIKGALVKVMRDAVASAKANAMSLASSLASMFAQARTAGDSGRLGDMEKSLSADQAARQESALQRAIAEARAEEAAKAAAVATSEDAAQAQLDLQAATQSRLDAEAQLSDFYRQRDIENLRTQIEERKTQYENDINNLAAQFGRGEISAEQFSASLDALIGGERGANLGGAFAFQFSLALDALKRQLAEIAAISGSMGITAAGPSVERPRDSWDRDVSNVKQSLESQWDKNTDAWKKDHPKSIWVAQKLEAWKQANAWRYGIQLAKGGIVTGPTPALIGEAGREAVLPLEGPRARRMLRAGGLGGPVVNITFNGVLNAKDAARMIRPELDRLVRLAV